MPFEKISVNKVINQALAADSELKLKWDESRTEYNVLGNLIKLRKEKGLSQAELAGLSGNKQQVISRIENSENSPTLKTLCSILDVLGYDIQFVPKEHAHRQSVWTESLPLAIILAKVVLADVLQSRAPGSLLILFLYFNNKLR